ncbi:hypothetical protein Vretifemale_4623, partial [Volvox reticuliferus]
MCVFERASDALPGTPAEAPADGYRLWVRGDISPSPSPLGGGWGYRSVSLAMCEPPSPGGRHGARHTAGTHLSFVAQELDRTTVFNETTHNPPIAAEKSSAAQTAPSSFSREPKKVNMGETKTLSEASADFIFH